jgi:FMN phosphatase YigB (HAD superfamily)
MPLTLEQYAQYLDTRSDLVWPDPPQIKAPKAKPHFEFMPEIRAVTWSLYGTLLSIASGDLYFEHPQKFTMEIALDKTIQEFNMWGSMPRKPGQPGEYLKPVYLQLVADQSRLSQSGLKHPEVATERVWEGVLKKLLQKDYRFDPGFYGALNEFSCKIAYFFHRSLQGTACQPKAAAALQTVKSRRQVQALIADAQCFSSVQLQRNLQAQDPSARVQQWIDLGVSALSYRVGTRKPSDRLFRETLDALKERGIAPEQVLHVGSRISLDVAPARKLGMRTALFAGDSESLEATAEQLRTPATRPDALITELDQIGEIVPVA